MVTVKYCGFEWDEEKNKKNYEKHGLYFDLAIQIFESSTLIEIDDRKNYGELRYNLIGKIDGEEVFITYTKRPPNLRLISFRKANQKERKRYQNYISNSGL